MDQTEVAMVYTGAVTWELIIENIHGRGDLSMNYVYCLFFLEKVIQYFAETISWNEKLLLPPALSLLWQGTEGGGPVRLKQKIQDTYGFRLWVCWVEIPRI